MARGSAIIALTLVYVAFLVTMSWHFQEKKIEMRLRLSWTEGPLENGGQARLLEL